MNQNHFFITGAMGCIGAWVVKNLVEKELAVTVFDISPNRSRLELIMDESQLQQVAFVRGDLTDTDHVKRSIVESAATHIIHLGALQVPFCKDNPPKGAAVNVVGTTNIFEGAREAGVEQVVFASSVAVYGESSLYSTELLQHDSELRPATLYGVFKQANEGTAAVYWQDHRIASIGLRPYTVYGPGRDQGLTSTPTMAMLAAAKGENYHISFGGYNGFQFVDDIAKIFIQAASIKKEGADVYNIRGAVVHVDDIVRAINAVEPSVTITSEDTSLPFPKGQTDAELRNLLGNIPDTSLDHGVAQTIDHFRNAIALGQI
ncbi:MAG: epimerase [Acidiferrobacteraceae bacterium]|nr:epimerase [Acidiferrobacteraceae bacterium]